MDMKTERRQWHLDKTFNVGHLFTTIALVVSFASYVMTMDKRIAVLEAQNQNQVSTLQQTQSDQKALQKEIRDELRALRGDLMSVIRDQGKRGN